MVLLQPAADGTALSPSSVIQREADEAALGAESTLTRPNIDPHAIADRVYRMMCDELKVERIRRGWE